MQLPFSHDAFLDVFGAFNTTLWPAVVLLWVITAGFALRCFRVGELKGRALFALLAVHWAWSAIAYHWFYLRKINQAAALFSAMFALQAGVFAWLAVTSRGRATTSRNLRGLVGGALVLYGLVYPFIGLALGLKLPRLPLFAVPCPTTLITAGLLVTSVDVPRSSNILPILWAVVGSSAAFALGIRADLALVVAGLVLAVDTVAPSALGARAAA
jgi:hypothetical protein